jgi:hypothetical protein
MDMDITGAEDGSNKWLVGRIFSIFNEKLCSGQTVISKFPSRAIMYCGIFAKSKNCGVGRNSHC